MKVRKCNVVIVYLKQIKKKSSKTLCKNTLNETANTFNSVMIVAKPCNYIKPLCVFSFKFIENAEIRITATCSYKPRKY